MIDKDIEHLKEVVSLAKTLPLGEVKVLEEESQAIDNVLSEFQGLREFSTETVKRNAELQEELEKYKKAYELETYERQKFIEELENWKKIAEKLADEWFDLDELFMIRGKDIHSAEQLLDWARKEVK